MKQKAMFFFIGIFLIQAIGCTTTLRNKQLEKVAKDWALVIRASQVIPVYPLTEDLQPGDVLLVSTPIEDQIKLYKEKGFLPLDQHLVRLYSDQFNKFYKSRFGVTDENFPPEQWQTLDKEGKHNWGNAPRAAFPTYQFSVNTGIGLNLAIPIQGVPVALGLMNSGKASGTVTIADGYTFGLDRFRLVALVQEWADTYRKELRSYKPQNGNYHFLRVISRVYVTGKVSVTINNDEATSAEARGGADKPLELLGIKKEGTDQNYTDAIAAINKFVSDSIPGGKLRFVTASSRSVTLNETFPRPLVIGYVGFDIPILEGGRLGSPISTLSQLTEGQTIPALPLDNIYRLAALSHMYQGLKYVQANEGESILTELNTLEKLLPKSYPYTLYGINESVTLPPIPVEQKIVAGEKIEGEGFEAVLDYLGNAKETVDVLNRYIPNAPRETQEQLRVVAMFERERDAAQKAIQEIERLLNKEPVLMKFIDLVYLGTKR